MLMIASESGAECVDSKRLHLVEELQDLLISHATGAQGDEERYIYLRGELCSKVNSGDLVPDFVHECRTLEQFWVHIKSERPTYQQRKQYIWESFRPLWNAIEKAGPTLPQSSISEGLASLLIRA